MLQIRRGTKEDPLEAISTLINTAYKKQPFFDKESRRLKEGELAELLSLPENELYLALDKTLCGTLLLTWAEEGRVEFSLLAVAPSSQGRKIGLKLLRFAENRAIEKGGRVIFLKVIPLLQEPLIAYYEQAGYRQTEKKAPFPEREKRECVLPEYRDTIYFAVLEKELS